MKLVVGFLAAICLPPVCASAPANGQFLLVQSPHFSIYTQAGEHEGRSLALWLEHIRAFFEAETALQPGTSPESQPPVRVIEFGSARDYAAFRVQPTADAFFAGNETTDYIVLPEPGSGQFRLAAHEFAHVVVHSLGLRFPRWLSEGLAEVFSTAQISDTQCLVGGDLPMRSQSLRQKPWLTLDQLLASTEDPALQTDRDKADIFYAESWAFTDMLMFSPAYSEHFPDLWSALLAGRVDADAMSRIYGKPLSNISEDVRAWVQQPRPGIAFPGLTGAAPQLKASLVPSFESRMLLADLLLASGAGDRADAAYRVLAKERPRDAAAAAALGTAAFRSGNKAEALAQWQRAIQLGLRDPALCYRYATLAEDSGLPLDVVADALRRAVEGAPGFDDARYQLGLVENTRGNYRQALEQFRAMRPVRPARAFGYWLAVGSALSELDQRAEAHSAAQKALSFAKTPDEREVAMNLGYAAVTDLTVQLARDANGKLQMVTARKPHGSTDWNPFIEVGDQIRSVSGQIRKVECTDGKITGFQVASASSTIEVALPDPTRVMIGGGKAEFVCGDEDGRRVAIQYAVSGKENETAGILRGLQFQQP